MLIELEKTVRFFTVAIILFATALWTETGFACSCMAQPEDDMEGVQVAFEHANIIFLGRVMSASLVPAEWQAEGGQIEETIFSVLQSWKGEQVSHVITRIDVQCCVCGKHFEVNADYLIYGYETDEDGIYSTSICTRSSQKKRATRDIEVLDNNVLDAKWVGPRSLITKPRLVTEADSIEKMLKNFGCAACHRIPSIEWAKNGFTGPLLVAGSNARKRLFSPEYQSAIQSETANARNEKEYIIESIMDPSAFIVPGFSTPEEISQMPDNYAEKFTYSAVEKLAEFLLSLDEDIAIQEGLDRSPFEKEGSLFP